MATMTYGSSDGNRKWPTHSANATSLSIFDEVNCELKRKTPLQLQTMENLYYEDKNPTQNRIEDYAFSLGLTFEQVRRWFIERRKKDKDGGAHSKGGKKSQTKGKCGKKNRTKTTKKRAEKEYDLSTPNLDDEGNGTGRRPSRIQSTLFSTEHIMRKVFRKDGPPLGVEFDHLPSTAFQILPRDMDNYGISSDDEQMVPCTVEMPESSPLSLQQANLTTRHGMGKGLMIGWHVMNCHPTKKRKVVSGNNGSATTQHGVGKGLMTVWRAMHPDGGNRPIGSKVINSRQKKRMARNENRAPKPAIRSQKRTGRKLQDKKKAAVRKRKVASANNERQTQPRRDQCRLALAIMGYEDQHFVSGALVEDEELELGELQAGPNPLTCTAHFSNGAIHGCPLCKGLLPRYPPNSVKMKRLLRKQPWDASLELVKKFFKVFHFLYTYAGIVDLFPFTIDEFAQAFHDKDSLFLGELHVFLLRLLLSDVEKELGCNNSSCTSKNCMFASLLHSAYSCNFAATFWKRSLNPLTWPEILRQVLVAAGYGLRNHVSRKEGINKVVDHVVRYGLSPGTLKGELFSILLEQGNKGATVYELTQFSQIESLNLTDTKQELEELICSVLASDITMFEKISKSAYRLRLNNLMNGDESTQSETESGSIDSALKECGASSKNDDLYYDSGKSYKKAMISTDYGIETGISGPATEIDESHQGEAWVLGLMEGEYSDLSIEEKLNILVALVDLLSAGSSIRMEDPETGVGSCVPKIYRQGSGAKIKRPLANENNLLSIVQSEALGPVRQHSAEVPPIDSASVVQKKGKCNGNSQHSMQSIFLGSDRRYNRYWLFLGPCIDGDPGHKLVYFESSEDGHWEIIETEEALSGLMGALDKRGRREAVLLAALESRAPFLCEEMSIKEADNSLYRQPTRSDQSQLERVRCESSSPVSDVDNHLGFSGAYAIVASPCVIDQDAGKSLDDPTLRWNRLQAYDSWIWNLFYSSLCSVKYKKCSYLDMLTRCVTCHDLYWRDEKHCRCCHKTFELDFDLDEKYAIHVATCSVRDSGDTFPRHKVLPSQLQALKAAIHAIEMAMPENALISSWAKSAHNLWVKRLRRASSLPELLQVLGDLLNAISEDWLSQCNVALDCDTTLEELIACFPNIPQTSSALALWVLKLDSLIVGHTSVAEDTGKRDCGS